MPVLDLTKQLVSLQSFDDGRSFERPMSDFLLSYAAKELPWMTSVVQAVAANRSNILIRDASPTRLLVIDHIDTVIPDAGWLTDPLRPVVEGEKIFGLGTSDSKGNVAAFLTALKRCGQTRGLALLFYVDEEYAFQGMKSFLASDLAGSIDPALILSIDGNSSALGLGCRGLLEFDVSLRSDSGHSANPKHSGALQPLLEAFRAFQTWLAGQRTKDASVTSSHLAFLRGGTVISRTAQGPAFAKEGNRIPNFAEAKIEIRTTADINWASVEAFWRARLATRPDLEMRLSPTIDYAGFTTSFEDAMPIAQAAKRVLGSVPLLDPSTFGYLDIAMMRQLYPRATLCSFGIGERDAAHRANEYIRVSSLEMGVAIYREILNATTERKGKENEDS